MKGKGKGGEMERKGKGEVIPEVAKLATCAFTASSLAKI
jgi:hypothetical protein